MKLVFEDFKLQPCDARELPRSSTRLGEGYIIRVPNKQESHGEIFTDYTTTWARVRYMGHEQAFRVLTLDGAPFTDMDEESASRRADAIATGFAADVDSGFIRITNIPPCQTTSETSGQTQPGQHGHLDWCENRVTLGQWTSQR